jgi:hypothetical protein
VVVSVNIGSNRDGS